MRERGEGKQEMREGRKDMEEGCSGTRGRKRLLKDRQTKGVKGKG